jgi:lysophospholipase L1-like esterase
MKKGLLSILVALALIFPLDLSADSFHPPKRYHLALGASYTFGFQEERFLDEVKAGTYDPATFNTGYVDDFTAMLTNVDPDIQVVNLGCPGQTSTTFLVDCRFNLVRGFALHANYADFTNVVPPSQLAAAVGFLQAHPGQVSPITIDLGQNDLNKLNGDCKFKSDCVFAGLPAVLDTFRANLTEILRGLRAAAPTSEILLLTQINTDALKHPFTAEEFVALNQIITEVAGSIDARIADAYGAFNLSPQPDTLCSLLGICTPPLFDVHPTDLGYLVMAQILWASSGYERFSAK